MRNSMRLSGATPVLRSIMACCTSSAQRTASRTLRNSMMLPSPVRLTTRPRCTEIVGSIRSLRSARSRARVRSRPRLPADCSRRHRRPGSQRSSGFRTQHALARLAIPQAFPRGALVGKKRLVQESRSSDGPELIDRWSYNAVGECPLLRRQPGDETRVAYEVRESRARSALQRSRLRPLA